MNRFFYNTLISSQKHPYHVVTKSPWPLSLSLSLGLSVLLLVLKLVSQIHFFFLHLSVYFVLFVIANWCENILTESSSGHHTRQVRKGLRLGFFLMIISEIMFFFSFFWTLFHYTFSLNIWHSEKWPYVWGIPELDCTPWIGTIFLIGSSFWISEAKIDFILGDKKKTLFELLITLWCGLVFMFIQLEEFFSLDLSFNSAAQSSLFFLLTGFHGLHVFLGMLFIYFLYSRILDDFFIMVREKSILFDVTIWYWHFVDYVWIFLFYILYGYFGQSFLDPVIY